jgi:hypothetical protein
MKEQYPEDSVEVQSVIRRHFQWLSWTAEKEAYIGLGQGYTEFEWKKAFEPYDPNHPRFAKYMAESWGYPKRELPHCAGYAVGYQWIKSYLAKTGKDIVAVTLESTEHLIETINQK